ncbi:type IV secretory system conjugative DNA transfer family protein [Caulobacter sp. DWP3-1-3b2]|uniref:type IV secretory system conjugative DNA transfer family protein n=1 Tax=Caulobacter sp. DWP3-1-3b2 TaxID=2804643 RepID=UPI003CFAEACD
MAQLVSRAHRVWSGSLDLPLLKLSPTDRFTVRDACENVFIEGGIGSGKTSGSGAALRRAYLRAGFGGLVLAAKPDEVELWRAEARACGRERSVIVFNEHHAFNFIANELARQGLEGIGSVIELLMRVLEAIRLAMPNAGHVGEAFFENAIRQLLRMTVPVLYAAHGYVRIEDILRFITSAAISAAQFDDEAWRQDSFMFATMVRARREPAVPLALDAFNRIASYWAYEFSRLDAKTRGNISISLSTALDRFMHGRLNRVFCQGTTVVPELTFHGAVIILDMSSSVWNEDGIIAQLVLKLAFQRAVLGRNSLAPKHRELPVFLWADEAQYFVTTFDPEFQSMSRSSRCSTVYLTQSLPTIYAKIGGENAKHRADMLLANFGTKIFHNNSCPETNRWAAETIGRSLQRRGSYNEGENSGTSYGMSMGEGSNFGTSSSFSSSTDGQGQSSSSSSSGTTSGYSENIGRNRGRNYGQSVTSGYSETMDWEIEPAEFSRSLKAGGPANGGVVSAIWFQAGRRFNATQRPWLPVSFRQ